MALITGASSGIGEAFVQALAARGLTLVLTGRDETRLRTVAREAAERFGVRVEAVVLNLADLDAPERLKQATDRLGLQPDLLVNNAGLGALGPFAEIPLERLLEIVQVNDEALVALTALYLPNMLVQRRGGIINVSSAASFQPIPYFAIYAASKVFVTRFSQALWSECRGKGIRVVVTCPGPVADTRFSTRAGSVNAFEGVARMPREAVVEGALRALGRGDPFDAPGGLTTLLNRVIAVAPTRPLLLVTERLFRRGLPKTSTGRTP
ncbi:MAG: SDR family oxidoreductase [Chloroflexi bacterium]|nr:SDR family oxidoreductase [Chloroflexota bacterium]